MIRRWGVTNKNEKKSFFKIPHLDIFQYYVKDKYCYLATWGNKINSIKDYANSKYRFPQSYIQEIIKIKSPPQFTKIRYFYIPKNYKKLLTELYGTWKIKSSKHAKRKIS